MPAAARSARWIAPRPNYEEGVSCPACHAKRSDAQRASYRERQRQEMLAAGNGRAHIGAAQTGRSDDA